MNYRTNSLNQSRSDQHRHAAGATAQAAAEGEDEGAEQKHVFTAKHVAELRVDGKNESE